MGITTGSYNVLIGTGSGCVGSNPSYKFNVCVNAAGGDTSSSKSLLYGDFSTGDLSLGQTSGTVTVLNDADIDGTLTLGSMSNVESSINTNTTNIATNATNIGTVGDLTTSATNLVAAINEHETQINSNNSGITSIPQASQQMLQASQPMLQT